MRLDSTDNVLNETVTSLNSVVEDPTKLASAELWKSLTNYILDFGLKLAVAAIILVVGFWLAKKIKKGLRKYFDNRDFDPAVKTFLTDFTVWTIRIIVVVTALSKLGIEMTSFLALLGAAGFAIGMAFSGALGNFAGGIILLVMRQYRVGDVVIAAGETGTVTEIQLFNTILLTFDNKTVIIPNGEVIKSSITNFTKQKLRRVDFNFGLTYGHNYPEAKRLILEIARKNELILNDPEPFVGLTNLGDSSVDLTLRVWSKTEDYWAVYFYLTETIYKELPEAGFDFPFPQMDVHLDK